MNTVTPSPLARLTDASVVAIDHAARLAYAPLTDGGNALLPWQVTALVEARCALLATLGNSRCAHAIKQQACPVRLRLIRD
jgi:hypothetical protein